MYKKTEHQLTFVVCQVLQEEIQRRKGLFCQNRSWGSLYQRTAWAV